MTKKPHALISLFFLLLLSATALAGETHSLKRNPPEGKYEINTFTYVSATWKMTREGEFDFRLADEMVSKTTIEMENQAKNVSKVDTIPDFVLDNKGTAVIRTRVTPVKE